MSFRTTRHKITKKFFLKDGTFLKARLLPWIPTDNGCVWLVSVAISCSNRQVNDWLNKRKNKRAYRLNVNLTGKSGISGQISAMRFLRWCQTFIPDGDSLCFSCECTLPDKQFAIWKRWFSKREDLSWEISEENKAFFYYKPKELK